MTARVFLAASLRPLKLLKMANIVAQGCMRWKAAAGLQLVAIQLNRTEGRVKSGEGDNPTCWGIESIDLGGAQEIDSSGRQLRAVVVEGFRNRRVMDRGWGK